MAGLLLAPQGVGSLASRSSVGKLADRLGAQPVVMAGVLLTFVGNLPFGGRRTPYRRAGASGSVNRSFCPDSVRHLSVTTAAQRRLLTADDTR